MDFGNTKTTRWFPVSTRPARPGVYEVMTESDESVRMQFSHWSRGQWHGVGFSPKTALRYRTMPAVRQIFAWRGLAANPKRNR